MIRTRKLKDLQPHQHMVKEYHTAIREGKSHMLYDYWFNLQESLKKGYDPKKHGYIHLNLLGDILDGNHRTIILQSLHDDNHEIKVKVGLTILPFTITKMIPMLFRYLRGKLQRKRRFTKLDKYNMEMHIEEAEMLKSRLESDAIKKHSQLRQKYIVDATSNRKN